MAGRQADGDAELCALGTAELGRLYRSRELSPVDVTRATLNRIERYEPEINAFISVMADSALEAARAAETQLTAGIDLGPLHGVPVSVKDIIRVKGTRTTAASRVLQEAPLDKDDAPVVRRLRAAGAILVGKVNLHEFAYGDPEPNGPFGRVQNPRKLGHQSGSSSSGSAAAVAAGLGVISLGTDTGGSIRHPASVCGVVGIKPTYGLVPTRGVVPLSSQLDHVGPIARSVQDVAVGLAAIAGHDPEDPSSARVPVDDYTGSIGLSVEHLRLGIPTNPVFSFGTPEVRRLVDGARSLLEDLGLQPVHVDLPRAEETNDISTVLMNVDLWLHHDQYRGQEKLYGSHFAQRAAAGLSVTGVEYARARAAKDDIRGSWLRLFDRVDLLMLPANVVGAPLHGQDEIEVEGARYPVRLATSRFNRASNLTGFPAMVLPIGRLADGLPVGVQLVGPPFGERRLLAVGHALEMAQGSLCAQWGIETQR